MGHIAACIDMYKSRGPLTHSSKGYGVHREPRLPDCIRHGLPTPYAFSVPTRFSGVCPNILADRQISNPRVCSGKSGFGEPRNTRILMKPSVLILHWDSAPKNTMRNSYLM